MPTSRTYGPLIMQNLAECSHYTNLSPLGASHTFSAKEKDAETGYSYFGSRYYSSDLSIWLSVDPMSDKYPHQSNYVYCSNNPIRLVDPNGEDEWDLARDGTLTKRENGRTDIDVVHAMNEKGENVSVPLDANTIKEMKQEKGSEYSIYYMNISNYKDATVFFEFAANNTDVEWGLMVTDQGNFVGTSKEPLAVESGTMVPKDATVLEDIHSHIPGHDVDAADKNVARINYGNNITTKVYHADSKSYSEFEYTFYSESQKQPHVTVKKNRVPRKWINEW